MWFSQYSATGTARARSAARHGELALIGSAGTTARLIAEFGIHRVEDTAFPKFAFPEVLVVYDSPASTKLCDGPEIVSIVQRAALQVEIVPGRRGLGVQLLVLTIRSGDRVSRQESVAGCRHDVSLPSVSIRSYMFRGRWFKVAVLPGE